MLAAASDYRRAVDTIERALAVLPPGSDAQAGSLRRRRDEDRRRIEPGR